MKTKKITNLSEEMQHDTIAMYHDNIRKLQEMKDAIMPKYEEKLAFLKQVREDFIEIDEEMKILDSKIEKLYKWIDAFKGFKGSEFEVDYEVRGVVQKRTAVVRVKWLTEISAIIKKQNKFLTWDEIWKLMGEDKRIVDLADQTKMGFKYSKVTILRGLDIHANNLSNTKGRVVSVYQDKYGLAEWVNHNGKLISPEHAKEFMGIETSPDVIVLPIHNKRKYQRRNAHN